MEKDEGEQEDDEQTRTRKPESTRAIDHCEAKKKHVNDHEKRDPRVSTTKGADVLNPNEVGLRTRMSKAELRPRPPHQREKAPNHVTPAHGPTDLIVGIFANAALSASLHAFISDLHYVSSSSLLELNDFFQGTQNILADIKPYAMATPSLNLNAASTDYHHRDALVAPAPQDYRSSPAPALNSALAGNQTFKSPFLGIILVYKASKNTPWPWTTPCQPEPQLIPPGRPRRPRGVDMKRAGTVCDQGNEWPDSAERANPQMSAGACKHVRLRAFECCLQAALIYTLAAFAEGLLFFSSGKCCNFVLGARKTNLRFSPMTPSGGSIGKLAPIPILIGDERGRDRNKDGRKEEGSRSRPTLTHTLMFIKEIISAAMRRGESKIRSHCKHFRSGVNANFTEVEVEVPSWRCVNAAN
ncbi:hypothetical protein C8F04DRAFT_1289106 [Mycena alexandri]|uniref:Uncharacterized protein n=1 Tax=Mycena alexandri TaxID=1745969 RepID=A0AAD6WZD0_9AGAR|nr:hypothetical protein C8F04DRAFT_1289106 [Mycena alexandri]